MSDRWEGAVRETGGRVEEAVGNVVGDAELRARGLANQAAGRVQNAIGQADEAMTQVRETIRAQPLTAAVIAAGIGYVIGRLTA